VGAAPDCEAAGESDAASEAVAAPAGEGEGGAVSLPGAVRVGVGGALPEGAVVAPGESEGARGVAVSGAVAAGEGEASPLGVLPRPLSEGEGDARGEALPPSPGEGVAAAEEVLVA
jgi:hypothetical protein